MSERWARAALTAYRWAGWSIYPFVGAYVALRASKGKEEPKRRHERYGFPSASRPVGPLIWFHAASVGETTAVVPLIEEIRRRGISVVLTTGTVTSASVARARLDGDVIHQYVPLDLKPAVSRFLDHWQPDLAVIAESEIWPMTILELGARRTPQVLVNGRLSDRSFARWRHRPSLAEALFENLSHVVAQSELDGERFRDLGARPVTVSGNLKVDTLAPPAAGDELGVLRTSLGERKTWAAISTHNGEEAIAADVHLEVKQRHDVVTIIVPRHPERGDEIEAMLKGKGLSVARRSRGESIINNTDIFLGDSIGEMGLYLRLTEVVFVGRSLTGEGGQNPLEPAMLGCAILSGRNVQNFRDAYQRLLKNGGAKLVRDPEMLAKAVTYLLGHDRVRRAMIRAAQSTVDEMRGSLDRTLKALDPYIRPLMLKAELAEPQPEE